jgi:SAM-dependent methyltransferase
VTLPTSYFDDLYASHEDPWGFRERWYERRKRDISVAVLPHRRYARAFEAGCSIGLMTEALAGRCDRLLAVDASEHAVGRAARALESVPHVRVERRTLPGEWPLDDEFDLVVLSEVGYYLDAADLETLVARAVASLAPDGVLLACHWRHPVADYPQSGDDVHRVIRSHRELFRVVSHDETDFLLEVFSSGPQPTVAEREGLVS